MPYDPTELALAQHSTLALVARRSRPYLVLLNEHQRIVYAEWDAAHALLSELGIERGAQVLPARLRTAVDDATARTRADAGDPGFVDASPRLIARITKLDHPENGPAFKALWIEASRQREDLLDATQRFGFTRREQEVLLQMLRGRRASEIATALSIAEGTVGDHFKALIKKTRARNRAEMVARVLDHQRTA